MFDIGSRMGFGLQTKRPPVVSSGQSWVRVITCRKIWIRISWLGSRSTWLFFIHAADVFSFQMSSVLPMRVQQILRSKKCPSSLHVFLLGEFAFRPTLKPPWRMHSLLSDLILASNPCCLTSSSSTHVLLLDVHFVDTVANPDAWRQVWDDRSETTGLRSHPKVEKKTVATTSVDSDDVHLALQFAVKFRWCSLANAVQKPQFSSAYPQPAFSKEINKYIYIYICFKPRFSGFISMICTGFTGICWSPDFFHRFCAQVQCHNAFGGKRIVNQAYSTWGNADELMNWLFTGSCNHALIGHVHWNRVQCWLTFRFCRCS